MVVPQGGLCTGEGYVCIWCCVFYHTHNMCCSTETGRKRQVLTQRSVFPYFRGEGTVIKGLLGPTASQHRGTDGCLVGQARSPGSQASQGQVQPPTFAGLGSSARKSENVWESDR